MPKTTRNPRLKAVHKVHRTRTKPPSVDKALADHLKHAEYHLIEAVKLFSKPQKPDRMSEYYKRLVRTQEMVTWLYRDELVRIRGPLSRSKR